MKTVLSILASMPLFLLGACGTTNSLHRPQPNMYYETPEGHKTTSYATAVDNFRSVFKSIPGFKFPANATLEVSWNLTPPSNYSSIAVRSECEVHLKAEYESESTHHPCKRIIRKGGDFTVTFDIPTEGGLVETGFNLSHLPGGFVEGGEFEVPRFLGMNLTYECSGYNCLRHVVWSTHEPIRWR